LLGAVDVGEVGGVEGGLTVGSIAGLLGFSLGETDGAVVGLPCPLSSGKVGEGVGMSLGADVGAGAVGAGAVDAGFGAMSGGAGIDQALFKNVGRIRPRIMASPFALSASRGRRRRRIVVASKDVADDHMITPPVSVVFAVLATVPQIIFMRNSLVH